MSRIAQAYGIGQALIPVLPPPIPFENPPTENQTNYSIGQVVYTPAVNPTAFYMYAGGGTWVEFATSSGDILSIVGTSPITASTVAGVATIGITGPSDVTSLTNHGVVLGQGAAALAATAVGTTGQVLIGASAANPAFGALGVNSGLSGIVLGNTNSAFTSTPFTAAGTFTPAFALATPGNATWTYSSQFGRYTQIGSIVYFAAQLVWSNFTNSTGSGTWQVNLPVTAGAFSSAGIISIAGSGIDANAQTSNLPANFLGVVGSGATSMVLSVQEGGTTNSSSALFALTLAQVLTTGTLNISGFYFAS